ncbi:DUF4145 domain-containing protein [Mycobacterium adipatum]|uniref:DUF4145 domain-containing protein n=1 Tax=Mycobacterium adipatum TaxID=1682113 RepID=UPI0034E05B1B
MVIEEAGPGRTVRALHWWPTPGFDSPSGAGVPEEVAQAYSEGSRCIAVGAPNAAVAMFRTALAHIVQEKGSQAAKAEGDLFNRIKKMAKEGALFASFADWAHHVRIVGNAGAHGEKFEPVTVEQATELYRFLGQMINFLYVQPAQLAAAMRPAKRGSS